MKIVFVRRRLFLSIEQLQAAAEGVLSNCILQVLQHKYSDNSRALYLESLMFDWFLRHYIIAVQGILWQDKQNMAGPPFLPVVWESSKKASWCSR